ncbi:MAG TPA: XRE family transcriptional regulator [Actinobacteria bacterium]|nr:XRE family transcriptional regulator [Actinomycetota bacterium]
MNKDILLLRNGSLLRECRKRSRLTLADVSRRCGVTVAQLSRIENGLVDPRLSTLVRILDAVGATLADIAVPVPRTVSVDVVVRRREEGRRRIEQAGLGASNVTARLDRRERTGVDSTSERALHEGP